MSRSSAPLLSTFFVWRVTLVSVLICAASLGLFLWELDTGNDLAIDMVAYGSDWLLGLSTFAPEAFAARDRALAAGDVSFLARNDALQHLGNVGFRAPVAAYKHAAAQYLHLTGGLDGDHVHPRAPRRPDGDRELLLDCALRVGDVADQDRERVYRTRVAPHLR